MLQFGVERVGLGVVGEVAALDPQVVIVSVTRSMTCRSECSRSGVPSVPRKYFWATMLVAFCDHVVGNSTSVCSKATLPSFQFVILATRRCQASASYGC